MSGKGVCSIAVGCFVLFTLVACASTTATATVPPTSTVGISSTEMPSRTVPPSSTNDPTIPPVPTTDLNASLVDPLVESNSPLTFFGWSPDGVWVLYREAIASTSLSNWYTINTMTKQRCLISSVEYAPDIRERGEKIFAAWQQDGKILSIQTGSAWRSDPCARSATEIPVPFPVNLQSIASVSPDQQQFLLLTDDRLVLYDADTAVMRQLPDTITGIETDVSWSPGSSRLAISIRQPSLRDAESIQYPVLTWMIDVGSAQPAHHFAWFALPDGSGVRRATTWLSEDHVLFRATRDRGPLLVSIDGKEIDVVSDLFGLTFPISCSEVPCETQFIEAHGTGQPDGDFHIILFSWGELTDVIPTMLYHSEAEQIESFDSALAPPHFSPDGEWLSVMQRQGTQFGWRQVDPPNSEMIWPENLRDILFMWPPDSQEVIAADTRTLRLYRLSNGELLSEVQISAGQFSPVKLFSPDGKHLVLFASHYRGSSRDYALIIIDTP
jgi:hypothetical protein